MPQRRTQTEEYWVQDFKIEQADLDYLYSVLLENETPLSVDEMALHLVRYRVQDEQAPATQRKVKNQYLPGLNYKVGAKLSFPSVEFATGKVVDTRLGDNPRYGDYTVVQVEFSGGKVLEFASGLSPEHLSLSSGEEAEATETPVRSPEELFIDFGGHVIEVLERSLAENEDLVRLAGRWFPASLLANVNSGHLNLTEAILDINGGGPMTTREILEQAEMMVSVSPHLAEFSLNYGLQQDSRFDEVGPAGQVLWYLTRMEPAEVQHPPKLLEYAPIPYDPGSLTPELSEIEAEIGDEHSDLRPRIAASPPSSAAITLIYPHRRAGTLPLSPQLRMMFPTAYQSPRIRFTLIDSDTHDEYPAWVVRPGGYVFGLVEMFEKHDVPVGSYLTIQRTDSPGRVRLSAAHRKARKEWVRTAYIEDSRLHITSQQRLVSTDFDDLMLIHVENPDEADALRQRLTDRDVPLDQILMDVMRELAASSPQGHVHAKTIYSAINVIRRSPPGPIFAGLIALPDLEHVGGPYWRIRAREKEN